jgi:hypothetical protein
LFGREWTREALLARVGDLAQAAGVQMVEYGDGAARGVRVAQVHAGGGLEFAVLLDRGMDIGPASFRGLPLAYISPAGFSHPAHYEPEGVGWLRTFGGGLLTGCGLTHLGAPGEDEGESLGLHGRLSLLPASHVASGESWEGGGCRLWVRGQMRQARLFGENLRLEREVSCWLGENRIEVRDVVENLAEAPAPLMVLYHINLGFPLLDEGCRLEAPSHDVRPRDADAAPGLSGWDQIGPPAPGFREQVFYHDLPAGDDGWAGIALVNPRLPLRLRVRFWKPTLPNLMQWKQTGIGAYVLGLEPANCLVEGRRAERERGTLQLIQPGERREFKLEIEVE